MTSYDFEVGAATSQLDRGELGRRTPGATRQPKPHSNKALIGQASRLRAERDSWINYNGGGSQWPRT